ncbi:SH3 domain-containing protein [Eisenbergiella sp.]
MNMDNRRRKPSHYNSSHHRKRRKRKISPLEYPSMLVKWMIRNKAMSAVLGVLLAVVIGTVVLVSWGMSRGKAEKASGEAESIPQEEASGEENGQAEETKEETEPLLENAYPEVNELITEYYAALQSEDLETVKSLFDYSEDKELLRMQENSSHIESYNNIVCYTKSGLEPDSYVVYACYDVKFVGFDTLVPGLTPFYVSKNEEGSFYIHDWEHDPEAAAYANKVTAQEDVIALYDRIRTGAEEKKAEDEALSGFLAGYVDDMKVAVGEALTEQKNAPESSEAPEGNTNSQEGDKPANEGTGTSEPAQSPTQPSSGKVPNSGEFTVSETVNVRKSANENSDRIGVCYAGDKLEILMKQADGWTRVKFQGETGYVKSDVLK